MARSSGRRIGEEPVKAKSTKKSNTWLDVRLEESDKQIIRNHEGDYTAIVEPALIILAQQEHAFKVEQDKSGDAWVARLYDPREDWQERTYLSSRAASPEKAVVSLLYAYQNHYGGMLPGDKDDIVDW